MIRTMVGLALATVVVAGEARAQIDLSVLDRGKPVEQMSISAILDQGKVVVGTTSATGEVTIPATTFQDGERVYVWVKRCEDGEVEIILARDGEDDPCVDEEAQAGEDCGCNEIGFFLWGGGPVTIDIGTGTVSQARTGSGASSFALGVGFDLLQMLELQDVVEEVDTGATDHDATSWAPGFQIFAEWLYRRILAIGIEGGYSRMDTEIRFPQGLQTGELDFYRLGVNAKVGPSTKGRFWPYATVGWSRGWNKGDFELDGLSDHRVHKTSLVGLGAGFDYDVGPSWAVRFEGLYSSTFEDPDADEHIRWKGALLWRVGRRVTLGYDRGGLHE